MKIGINLIYHTEIQGIEVFAKNLVDELIRLDKNVEFILFTNQKSTKIFNFNQNNVRIIEKKFKSLSRFNLILYQQFYFGRQLKKLNIDILFCPSVFTPLFYKNKIVVIHDCAPFRLKRECNIISRAYLKLTFFLIKLFSRKIITVSEFSKKELVDLLKIGPHKIEVIHEATPKLPEVDYGFIEKTIGKFQLNKPYFIYIGITRPRKNILGLLRAFKKFLEKHPNFLLVLAGKIDTRFLNISQEIEKLGLKKNVIQADFISSREKVALYKKAIALTFPSFYEGFGLPALEAQSLGIPVLTSNISSLPETAGKGALYINPCNVEEIAKGMEKIAFDKIHRESLVKKGFENIQRFSWEKSAEEVLKILKNTIKNEK